MKSNFFHIQEYACMSVRHFLTLLIQYVSFSLCETQAYADLTSSALWLVAAMENWVVRCKATQFAVAATNHSALGSDEMRSVEMWLHEVR